MDLDWKKLLIFGLGILSIVLIYFCYKNYEGFQTQPTTLTVESDTFVGSKAVTTPYPFSGSIVSLRKVYDDILDVITNYRSFTGIANSIPISYNSRYYKKFITINDFSVNAGGGRYWYPYTGQYGPTGNWLNDFASETSRILDLDVYNSNIDRYKNFVRTGTGSNRQKFLFKRSLARPSLLYSNIELATADSRFNIYNSNADGTITVSEINITEIRNFDSNTQSWWANFISYAKPNQNLYPPSDYQTDTAYKILYDNPKPTDLPYSNVTNGKNAGTIVTRIPDYRENYQSIINEQLNLNVYGTLLPHHQTDFQECMFWGSVFTNFNDQATMESILNVPFKGSLNGSEIYYSFNLFEPEITSTYNISTRRFGFSNNNENIDYNSNLVSYRSGNTIRPLTDAQIIDNGFKNNVRSNAFNAVAFSNITSMKDAYVGKITPSILSKLPSLARRYITSWAYNRSTRYLPMNPLITITSNLTTNDITGVNLINRAVINSTVPANSFTLFLNTYASYFDNSNNAKITQGNFTMNEDASLTGVHNEEVCKRIIAGSRIYNTYTYNETTKVCRLSKTAPTGTGTVSAPLSCGTLFTQTLGAWSAIPAVVKNVIRETSTFKSLIEDIVEVINASLKSLTTTLSLIPIDSITTVKSALTNPLLSFSDAEKTSITNAFNLLSSVSSLANTLKNSAESVVRYYEIENVNDATLLINSFVNVVNNIDANLTQANSSLNTINSLVIPATADDTTKSAIEKINNQISLAKLFTEFYKNNYSVFINAMKGIQSSANAVKSINDGVTPTKTDDIIKTEIDVAITDVSGSKDITSIVNIIETVQNQPPVGDPKYDLLKKNYNDATSGAERNLAEINLNQYLYNVPKYVNANKILTSLVSLGSSSKGDGALTSLYSALTFLKNLIGTGTIANSKKALTNTEIIKMTNDYNDAILKNKLLPDYGDLKNLNITDEDLLNKIAQYYYEQSDGLYEMTSIYDVYTIGSNMVDIRFDKKQRLPNSRINNLTIQYLPQVKEYNRLLDMIDDGSWTQFYKDSNYTTNIPGQVLKKDAIDFYYEDLSAARNSLEPILNPIYPVNININVKDLQRQLSNYVNSNETITKILTGKLSGLNAPVIAETATTVGLNYTDRLNTIQSELQEKIYTIETQISGILQGCARVFIHSISSDRKKWAIDGMALGIQAALTYNKAYNGNFEVDMGAPYGNIGAYQPLINYTKNLAPPIICGDLDFIKKAASLFSQTAFLNLSSFTTQITGDDKEKRLRTDTTATTDITKRSSNFYDSNNGSVYVDKILGFQQVNSNTCYYRWVETQYDPLTNGPFIDSNTNTIKQRTVNLQYQFTFDNSEYQNPQLLPDNNNTNKPNEGFKYLPNTSNVPFGDLYMSLYTWYATATRDLYTYLNQIDTELNIISNSYYNQIIDLYNNQNTNISNYNINQTLYASTNLVIKELFSNLVPTLTASSPWEATMPPALTYRPINVKGYVAKTCDSITVNPPYINDDLVTVRYNFRPGDANSNTAYNDGTNNYLYNKYRDVPLSYFISTVVLGPSISLNATGSTSNSDLAGYTVHQNLFQPAPQCAASVREINPANCFIAETDRCKFQYTNTSLTIFSNIMSNIGLRDSLYNNILSLTQQMNNNTVEISTLMSNQITLAITNNIIDYAGYSVRELYPIISKINDRITYLTSDKISTQSNINSITIQYNTLLSKQRSDPNLKTYMTNREIPLIKILPEEAPYLDDQNAACGPAYNCKSVEVIDQLLEQYNLDSNYDDTILRVLKAATPSKFQCDYLLEVRKKNVGIPIAVPIRYLRFIPLQQTVVDNRRTIYFNGTNFGFTQIPVATTGLDLSSNNFTIDWHQYSLFDGDNLTPVLFSIGSAIKVSYEIKNDDIVKFNLFLNNNLLDKFSFEFNYNQLNRWSYIAIVRYNNIITCYKDGFAFISQVFSESLISIKNSSIFLGNDGTNRPGTFFKGGIQFFRYNNYDALYTGNFFNTIPTTPIKNINTRFILQPTFETNFNNTVVSKTFNSSVELSSDNVPQLLLNNQNILTNGSYLKTLVRTNNINSSVAFRDGFVYISDTANHQILKINNDNTVVVVAGTGFAGRSSDSPEGQVALLAAFNSPTTICEGANNIYIADTGNNRICEYDGTNVFERITNIPNIRSIAYFSGSLYFIYEGEIYKKNLADNLQPTIYVDNLMNPNGICFDATGNLYVANTGAHTVLKITPTTPRVVTTIAGQVGKPTNASNPLGDFGVPTSATLNSPVSVSVDSTGKIFIADAGNNRLRMIMNNIIYTVVGNGTAPTDTLLEGYGSLIQIRPQFVVTVGTTLYINDSKRICEIKESPIPLAPPITTYKYNFSNVTIAGTTRLNQITVGSDLDSLTSDFIFKTDFTVQWFMYMNINDPKTRTIFTLEDASNNVVLGFFADKIGNGINITLTINNINNTIVFNNAELSSLWVHFGIVYKNSNLMIFKNGILIRIFSNIIFNQTTNPVLTIGNRRSKNVNLNFYGYITNFNILNGFAINYNNQIINYNVYTKPSPNLVLCLGIDNPVSKDYSLVDYSQTRNNIVVEQSYPYSSQFNISEINVYNSMNLVKSFSFNRNTNYNYGTVLSLDIGRVVNINQFNFMSGKSLTKTVQQWRLEGSQDNVKYYELNAQNLVPFVARFGERIYPKENSFTQLFSINTQVNIGGDVITMTKRFNVAREIGNCTMVITSNISYNNDGTIEYLPDGTIKYLPGVTSSNGFFIQDNTPYIEDSSGTDISGYQFIGGALKEYNNLVKNSFDPLIDSAENIQKKFLDAYSRSRLDTYAAIGKLNTTGFNCASFQDYDTLKTYMVTRTSFTDTIFDSYPYSNAYMSNIIRFAIADSNMIDIIFTKQNLNMNGTAIEYTDKTTAGARYKLSVSQGFCDLSATFISDIVPFKPNITNVNNSLFNEYPDNSNNLVGFDDLDIDNTRGKDYKDRLNQTQKFLSGKRTPLTSVTTSAIPTDVTVIQQLTGLRNIGSSNIINASENRIEYMLNVSENLPIGKRCFIVQYVNTNEVNSVIRATLENTSFKKDITSDPLTNLVTTFRNFFNSSYSIANNNPYNSIISRVYGTSIVNNILTLSVGIEYTKTDNSIYYNKVPNILEFGTNIFYKIVFKNDGNVLAFEPTSSTSLTAFTDGLLLLGGNKNTYINNLLWRQMKFIPVSSSIVSSYSISQLEFYNNETKVRVGSLSTNNPTNFNLDVLIDGVNVQAQIMENVRFFTHTYSNGEIVANFREGTQINGFSFMTGYSYYNPQKWIVQGSCDGETFVELMNQNTMYGDIIGYSLVLPNTIGYVSFYHTPIFSFTGSSSRLLEQPRAISAIPQETTDYSYIRIRGDAKLLSYQLVNISLFNNTTPVAISTNTTANTITYNASGTTSANENIQYLFRFNNIDRTSPIDIKMLEVDTSSVLTIQFTTPVKFNGLSFISGIDRDKCLLKWNIEVSTNGTSWLPFLNQNTSYINDKINYPHYFCRTPIFYKDGLVVETDQIPLYKTLGWPIRFVRFKPIYMYGPYANEFFELSQFEFFNSTLANPKITPPTSTANDSLLRTNIVGERDILPVGGTRTQIANLPNYRGSYFDPNTNVIQFSFSSPINFDGFSFMSGSSQFTAIQLWTLEVSIDGNMWAIVHSNEYEPATVPNAYPSAYYRLPIIYFDKNIKIISNVKYYLVTGDPSSPTNNGTVYPVNIYFSKFISKSYVSFSSIDGTDAYNGLLIKENNSAFINNAITWETFNNAFSQLQNTINASRTYPNTTITGAVANIGPLYSFNLSSDSIVGVFFRDRLDDIPPIDNMDVELPYIPTKAKLYVNTIASSGAVIDTNSTFYLQQIIGWVRPTTPIVQGFTNQTDYVRNFILQTNKPFNISFFRFIGPNNRQIKPVLYKITKRNDRFYIIQLNANIEVIGYSIRTTLYTKASDVDSWKLYGMKNNNYVLLDKKDKIHIPNERSKDVIYYFNKDKNEVAKKQIKQEVKEEVKEDIEIPDLNTIKNYYKSKINQFSNPEFKMYMFDGNKTYYILFDEYDNNKRLVGKNHVIGFVIVDGKIKKPVMYENSEGNYEAFDLSDKKVINYWNKYIGLELRFTSF